MKSHITFYHHYLSEKSNSRIDREISNQFLTASLSSYLNSSITIADIEKDKHGKPYLVNYKNVFFSLSHSENYIILAASREKNIGLDLQIKRQVNSKIWDRITTADEKKYFEQQYTPDLFFNLWSIKEAALKFYGSGLKFPMNRISVNLDNSTLTPLLDGFDFVAINDLQPQFIQYPTLQFKSISLPESLISLRNYACYIVESL